MKCPQCGLNNLEHIDVCVKCGCLLVAGSLPEDFSPEAPRAGKLNPIRRLYWKWRRSRRIILPDDGPGTHVPFWKKPFSTSLYYGEPVPGSLLAMFLSYILPGSGQLLMGRRLRGIAFIIPAILTLLVFALAMSTYLVDGIRTCMNVYLVLQCISVFDAMPKVRASRTADIIANIIIAASIWFVCFFVINTAIPYATRYFWSGSELRIIYYNFPESCIVQYNDTLLLQKKDAYERGNIVMYTCSVPYLYNNRTRWNTNYITIGKILGVPGETVTVKNAIISVNSIELENQAELTLRPQKIPDMEWTLGTDEYFIISSTLQQRLLSRIHEERRGAVQKVKNITGQATRIVSPFARRKDL